MTKLTCLSLAFSFIGSFAFAAGAETKAVEDWQRDCVKDGGTVSLELVQADGKSRDPYAVFSCSKQDGTIAIYAAPLFRL